MKRTPLPFSPGRILFSPGPVLLLGLAGLSAGLLLSAAAAQPPQADATQELAEPENAEPDYSDLLPPIPPREPADALASIKPRPGFRVELVAAEPLIRDPVALDFDEYGRMFVVEMPEYNQYANPEPFEGHGCVKLLEDTTGDGRFDKATVYADELDTPVAVACYDGGIFVGAVPDILYFKDTTGDGRADVRRRVYTGFGRDDAGEAMLNSFRWGLDNRFHVSTSMAGGDVRAVDRDDAEAVSVRNRGFVFDPRSLEFELTSGGGQHGMSLDDWGRKFVCTNSDPAQLLMYDDRYLARNPLLEAPGAVVNIAPDGKYTKLFRISPVEPWRALRTRLRSEGIVRGSDEGGEPSGFFTGATGVTIYRGDDWPDEYRGGLLVGDVANNVVYRARLEPDGVSLKAVRADAEADFVAAQDVWFRPVQFANAPDGTLYVIDMYRELIEGAAFLPPQILKHLDVAGGMDRGRIYRIVSETPDGGRDSEPPAGVRGRMGDAEVEELVALLEHPNGWHRDTASRLLYERQDRSAVAPLRALLAGSQRPLGRLHAMAALDGLGALDADAVLAALDDPDPRVRRHAVRLSERHAADSPAVLGKLLALVEDQDRLVRYQLAFSLGEVPAESRAAPLVRLLRRDGADRWVRLAALSSLGEGAGEVFRRLAEDEEYRRSPHGRGFLETLASQIGSRDRAEEVAAVIKVVGELPAAESALSQSLVERLVAGGSAEVKQRLLAAGRAGDLLEDLLQSAERTAEDEQAPLAERVPAVRTLGLSGFQRAEKRLVGLLDLRHPQEIQTAALETLGRFDDPAVADHLLRAWPGLSPLPRSRAAEILFSRPSRISAFLDGIEDGIVSRADVDPARIRLLESHPDEAVRERVSTLFAGQALARRQDVVDAYQPALEIAGDVEKGRAIFRETCAACHRLEGVGQEIGADLNSIRDRGPESMLMHILDPNREVKPQFLAYVAVTTDGEVLTGMITTETANSLTLRRNDGTDVTVRRAEIEELRSTGLSFMPEGLEQQIDVPAMADLLAYLNSIR